MKTRTPETDVESDAPSATSKLRTQSETVREDLREFGRLTKDAAQEKLGEAKELATGYYDQGRKKAVDLEDQLLGYVREKPLKSLLIATGVGVLLGALWSRR